MNAVESLGASKSAVFKPVIIFLVYFCISTAFAILFQKLVLPAVDMVAQVHGLLRGDSSYFHQVALKLAEDIRSHGWSAWRVYPGTWASGNVALLGALYVVFTPDPSLLIPINAGLHALSGTALYILGRMLWPGRIGGVAGLVTGSLFVVFPSALNWYGQIHKDGYAIPGVLLILTGWVLIDKYSSRQWKSLVPGALSIVGLCLILFVRPYNLVLIAVAVGAMSCASILVFAVENWRKAVLRYLVLHRLLLTVLVFLFAIWAPKSGADDQNYANWDGNKTGSTAVRWQWNLPTHSLELRTITQR